jgi:hypothetical protein
VNIKLNKKRLSELQGFHDGERGLRMLDYRWKGEDIKLYRDGHKEGLKWRKRIQ